MYIQRWMKRRCVDAYPNFRLKPGYLEACPVFQLDQRHPLSQTDATILEVPVRT
jgi:hypothetical protein